MGLQLGFILVSPEMFAQGPRIFPGLRVLRLLGGSLGSLEVGLINRVTYNYETY